jgi:hypothetical protein
MAKFKIWGLLIMDISTKNDRYFRTYNELAGKDCARVMLDGPCEFVIERCHYFLVKKEMDSQYKTDCAAAISKGEDPDNINPDKYDPLLVMPEIWQHADALRKLGSLDGANPYEYMLRFEASGKRMEKGWAIELGKKTFKRATGVNSRSRGDRLIKVKFVDDNNVVIGTSIIDYSTSLQKGSCDEFRSK